MCFVAFIIFKISFNNEDIVVSYNIPFLLNLNSQTVKLFFSQDCQQLDAKMAANLALILGHPIRRDLEILLEPGCSTDDSLSTCSFDSRDCIILLLHYLFVVVAGILVVVQLSWRRMIDRAMES